MKQRHVPMRMCVVCRESSVKRQLLRVVRTPGDSPQVVYDRTGKANGRGAYVCATVDCIEKAVKQKRFQRSLSIGSVPDVLLGDLLSAVSESESTGPIEAAGHAITGSQPGDAGKIAS